jgi:hypothetical protein
MLTMMVAPAEAELCSLDFALNRRHLVRNDAVVCRTQRAAMRRTVE